MLEHFHCREKVPDNIPCYLLPSFPTYPKYTPLDKRSNPHFGFGLFSGKYVHFGFDNWQDLFDKPNNSINKVAEMF